ncbi:hypothetical protein LUZ63_015872 [Rhynchospora breviuscula]|uniref:Costars family protein n=1 Tax=Rhynchospora breviuscula TaxID=2022672 RepID=A0A9Q0CDE7_9POAL|nr:hypothetical protein LUZ63_015872 [Rhynchospora breviuscula]
MLLGGVAEVRGYTHTIIENLSSSKISISTLSILQLQAMNVEEEVGRLKEEIQRLGQAQSDGSYKVTFGVLFNDDRCANIFEALVGTLRAAKKRKVVTYDGELLLQGVHDNVEIILLRSAGTTAAA